MKKIMFNDKYGLTQKVLKGIKTQTRRLILSKTIEKAEQYRVDYFNDTLDNIPLEDMLINANQLMGVPSLSYHVGEEVAIAQSYRDILGNEYLPTSIEDEIIALVKENSEGMSNKMFVRADLMPHRIKITNIRVERLQDISEEDCLKEGIEKINVNDGFGNMLSHWEYLLTYEDKLGRSLQLGSRFHKEAFSFLIDKTCGIGTWESNPYVFVYDFELTQ